MGQAWLRLDHGRYRNPIAGLQLSTSSNTALTYSIAIVEAGGLYEFARWPGSPGSFTALDGLLGFRYWNTHVDVNFDFDASVDFVATCLGIEVSRSFAIAHSGSLDWIDPVIGLRLRHQFTPSQASHGARRRGRLRLPEQLRMAGARRLQLPWQFSGYQLAGLIGYRALGVNYTDRASTNSVNLVLHGPIIGASVRF